MIHPYILCPCEEAAVIAEKNRGVCLKCHLMCVPTEFYGILLLLFPNKVNTQQSQWDRMGQSLPGRKREVTYLHSGIIKTMLVTQTFNFGVGGL